MTKLPNPYGERAERLRETPAALVVDLRLFPTEEGGIRHPLYLGYCCPCFVEKDGPRKGFESLEGAPPSYDGCPLVADESMYAGDERRVGFWFLWEGSAEVLRRAGHFYLWEGGFVGEAQVVSD